MAYIVVDFDGTITTNADAYPDIGPENKIVSWIVQSLRRHGNVVGLWTCRMGAPFIAAKRWSEDRNILFDFYNENDPVRTQAYGGDPRKVSADFYLDDKATSIPITLQAVLVWVKFGPIGNAFRRVFSIKSHKEVVEDHGANGLMSAL